MFFYGLYKKDSAKNAKGVVRPLSEFKSAATSKGCEFIAYSLTDTGKTDGWLHFVCSPEMDALMDECLRFWEALGSPRRGRWEMYRLDGCEFPLYEHARFQEIELKGNQLIFG